MDAGLTCPNVDGTVAIGGCAFCDNRSFSPSRRVPRDGITGQIERGIDNLRRRYANCRHYLAYFQPATNTYAPVERLRPLYAAAVSHPEVVGLVVGTRPDCVPDDVLELLEAFAADCFVSVEYGMQSMHNRSLDWMNRGHHHDAFDDAMQRSDGRGFEISAHVIFGLPGESDDDMMATGGKCAKFGVDAVKIHNLYAVEKTPLADQVRSGEVKLMERDEYVKTLIDFLELLPANIVVERISGEAPGDYFVGPEWCRDKPGILKAVAAEFERRDSWQGKMVSQQESIVILRNVSKITSGLLGYPLTEGIGVDISYCHPEGAKVRRD